MSKNRSAAGITNIVQYDANKNITFVSGSSTLLTVSSSGALTTTGTITAQTLVVQTITSSVNFVTGSTKFGAIVSNTHQFTGSLNVTGSLSVVTTGTEFQVSTTGVNLGNVLTDSHVISGSLRVNPNGLFVSGSGIVGVGTVTPTSSLDVRVAVESPATGRVALAVGTSNGANDIFRWYDGTTQLGVFKNSGNIGIGTTNTDPLSLNRDRNLAIVTTSTSAALTLVGGNNGRIDFGVGSTRTAGMYSDASNYTEIFTSTALPLLLSTNNTERMRILSGGSICINTTSIISAGRLNIVDDCNSVTPIEIKDTASTVSGQYLIRFVNNSNVVCGNIAHQTSTTVQYNTSSDYRLKTDLKNYNGLDLISKIKTYDFEWIEDKNRMYGVLAHELAEVLPYAVNGEKDGEQMQGVDYSKIVPVLVKAIQELKAEIDALKAQ